MTREAAESLAIQALVYLAEEPDRLARFLAVTGLEAQAIRRAAREPGFLLGVLEHVAGHEPLLIAFAAAADVAPEDVDRARTALAGPVWERDTA